MKCAEWQDHVAAYADGELTPSDRDAFRSHLEHCSHCAASALALAEGKAAVRRAGDRYDAPTALRQRLVTVADGQASAPAFQVRSSSPSMSRFWLRGAFAMAALVALVAALFVVNGRRQQAQALGEFADLHVATLASSSPVEVVSSDRHTVKPWFQGKIPFTFDVPELQNAPFSLLGGRVTYFRQEPGAQLVFAHQRHLVSVFIFRDAPQLGLSAAGADRTSSFSLQTWKQAGLRYVVIGDAPPATIQELSELLQHAQ